jgi:hypothetical protein
MVDGGRSGGRASKVCLIECGAEGIIRQCGEVGRTRPAGVAEAHRDIDERVAKLLIRDVQMLVREEAEEFVLDDGPTHGSTRNVAMQLGILHVLRHVRILLEEERRSVDPVSAVMHVGRTVKAISARRGAEIDVRAGGGTLFGVVHRSIHANFFNGLRSRCGNGIADGQIDEGIISIASSNLAALETRLLANYIHVSTRQRAALRVRDHAGDASRRLLCCDGRDQQKAEQKCCQQTADTRVPRHKRYLLGGELLR